MSDAPQLGELSNLRDFLRDHGHEPATWEAVIRIYDAMLGAHRRLAARVKACEQRPDAIAPARSSDRSLPSGMSVSAHHASPQPKVRISFRGMWDPDARYAVGDGIVHRGGSFRCLSPSKGIDPSSRADIWERFA